MLRAVCRRSDEGEGGARLYGRAAIRWQAAAGSGSGAPRMPRRPGRSARTTRWASPPPVRRAGLRPAGAARRRTDCGSLPGSRSGTPEAGHERTRGDRRRGPGVERVARAAVCERGHGRRARGTGHREARGAGGGDRRQYPCLRTRPGARTSTPCSTRCSMPMACRISSCSTPAPGYAARSRTWTRKRSRGPSGVTACGGFLVGRRAAMAMRERGSGSIQFTGASASVKGYPESSCFAMGKFALRGLAQSMARELAPQGIHVAHFVNRRRHRKPGARPRSRTSGWTRTPSRGPTCTSIDSTAARGPGRWS